MPTEPAIASQSESPGAALEDLARPLRRVRAGARRLLVTREAAWMIACLAASVVGLGLADYALRLPWGLRLALWVIGLTLLVIDARKRLLPALRFNPPLSEIALRVERTRPAAAAGLRGVLAAGLELADPDPRTPPTPLRARVVTDARERLNLLSPSRAALIGGPVRNALVLAVLALAPLAAVTAWQPGLASIGLRRVLTPWSSASWPKRTAVHDATALTAHPLGAALPLRAVLTRTDRPPGRTDVWAMYRLIDGERQTPLRRALLTAQGRSVAAPGDVIGKGELYERLIESSGAADAPAPSQPLAVEYWFETDDDRTDTVRVALVEPPSITGASAEITPPPYAAGSSEFLSGVRPLGNGRDEQASAGPVLAGSRVELTMTLNKPLGVPADLADAFPGAALPADASLRARDSSWTLSWTARTTLRLPVMLVDEHGIRADRDAAFQFGVVADRPPAAAVVEPPADESVLATAIIGAAGEARDDVGVSSASLEMQTARAPASQGAPAEPAGEPAVLATTPAVPAGAAPARQASVSAEIDLSTLSLKPRDELWLTALASDAFAGDGGAHEVVRSSVRRLRIISDSELVEQVRAELAGVRQAALRLDQDQGDIARRAEVSSPADLRPLQDGVSQRIAPQGEVVKRLAGRTARNNLMDRSLAGLLQDSAEALETAERASRDAAERLAEADRSERDPVAREALARRAGEAQRSVRDQLGRLIAMLDRGQDGYTVRREVQRLIDDQKNLLEQTRELGAQTRGQKPADLPQGQRDSLEQAAGQQADLARRAAQAIADMAQRSVDLQRQDPALAQALQKSAERARQDQLPDRQRQASEQIRQNQTSTANQSQEQALQSLRQMMQDLDQTERQRDEALKRVIEDAIQSIQALIAGQERELASLGRALQAAAYAGLDGGMIRLNTDTIGVAEKIRTQFRELATVADALDAAARAQATAVTVLRAQNIDGAEADRAERLSLEQLRAAREEAERLRREADAKDQSQKRENLRRAYQEVLDSQLDLHARTAPLLGQELDRRQRAGVRGLGERQIQIRARLAGLRDENPGLAEAKLFAWAHGRLDETTARAGAALAQGSVTASVDRDQTSAVRVLQSLVEALKDAKPRDFRDSPSDSQQGGGSQGGKSPLIAPLAELRLLRLMQVEVADLTRAAGEDQAAGKTDPTVLEELGRMQRDLTTRAEELLEDKRPADEPAQPQNSGASFGAPPTRSASPPTPAPSPAPRPPPTEPRPADQDEPAPGAQPPGQGDPLPSLDELLGLPAQPAPRPGEPGAAPDAVREDLERRLAPDEATGAQAELLALLRQAAQRLVAQRDPGVATQRAQAEAIKRLEQLIDAQERNQQQSSSRSGSRRQQAQQQQAQPQPSQAQAKASTGDNRQMADPPGREDGPLKPPAPGAGARWGSLPEHIREALTQGRSDRYSALYRSLTEEYYRRLAEDPKQGSAPDPKPAPSPAGAPR